MSAKGSPATPVRAAAGVFGTPPPITALDKSIGSISEQNGSTSVNCIKVICRIRPPLDADRNDAIVTRTKDQNAVDVIGRTVSHDFTFDKVFDGAATQQEVYEFSIKDIVDDVFQGYNGTVLAYGQTGSGKSYTMLGPNVTNEDTKGLIPRISDEIFSSIRHGPNNIEYTVGFSAMEIYLEQINDLLNVTNTKLTVHEDKEHGIYVKGLSQGFISNTKELYRLLMSGIKNRSSAATNMNLESSRSHAIFQIKLSQRDLNTDVIKKSNLFLVDLAGSEKVDKTGAVGHTLQETKNINSSLSTLGLVINALTDHRSTHVPYRDSKLTRILQESLGGNARTTLILNVAPGAYNEPETLSTLRFGSRAKKIKNHAHINTELSVHDLKLKIRQLERINEQNQLYIKQLENDLNKASSVTATSSSPVVSPRKGTPSRIPMPVSPSPVSTNKYELMEQLNKKDARITELENEILEYRIKTLEIANDEEIKLNRLEKSLNKLNQKLSDVEIINVNLRKHLMISEKVIESRESTINFLKKLLSEQNDSLGEKSALYKRRLNSLRNTIDATSANELNRSPNSPSSPKLGLNLKIIKPIRGGEYEDENLQFE